MKTKQKQKKGEKREMNSNDKLIDVIMKQLDRLEEKQEEVYRKLTAIEERTKATQEDIEETKDKVKELEEMKDEFYKYKNIIMIILKWNMNITILKEILVLIK